MMTRLRWYTSLAGMSGLALFGLLLGDPQVLSAESDIEIFLKLDVNQDGVLSGKEAATVRQFDSDGDGEVTKAEYLAGLAAEQKRLLSIDDDKLFAERDTNSDNWLSGTEVKRFEKYDSDGDGEVSQKEFAQGRAAVRRKLIPADKEELARLALRRFRQIDANEDGRLSGREMDGYEKLDVDGDHRISEKEFVAGADGMGFETTPPDAFKWVKVATASDGVTFEVPSKPQRTVEAEKHQVVYRAEAADQSYIWVVNVETVAENLESKADAVFRGFEIQLAAALEGKIVESIPSNAGKHPGRTALIKGKNGICLVERTVIVGLRVFRFQVVTNEQDKKARDKLVNHFFESATFVESDDANAAPMPDQDPARPAAAVGEVVKIFTQQFSKPAVEANPGDLIVFSVQGGTYPGGMIQDLKVEVKGNSLAKVGVWLVPFVTPEGERAVGGIDMSAFLKAVKVGEATVIITPQGELNEALATPMKFVVRVTKPEA